MHLHKISLLLFIISMSISAQNFWFPLYNPLGLNLQHMKVDSTGNIYIMVGPPSEGEIYKSSDDGNSWEFFVNAWDIAIGGNGYYYIYVGDPINQLKRSIDGGNNWVTIKNGLARRPPPTIIDVTNRGDIIFGGLYGIIISTNYGNTWEDFYNGDNVRLCEVTKGNDIYISANIAQQSGILIKTTDYGHTFQQFLNVTRIYDVEVNSIDKIFALSLMGYILGSSDNGASWDTVYHSTSTTTFYISSNDNLYVANYGEGVQRSTNSGINWHELNSGLVNYFNYGMVEDFNHYLYVATNGDGVFKSVEPITLIKKEELFSADRIYLYQNYPNPFNPTTSLQYAIGSRQFVMIKVYDLLGREIATLVNEEKPAGQYEVEFVGTNLPSGIYFYQLKAGGYVETKKMVLIK